MDVAYKNISISLPEELAELVELVRQREHRSRSEVMREALRLYFKAKDLVDDPLPEELEAIRRGRDEVKRGEHVSLAEVLDDLGGKAH